MAAQLTHAKTEMTARHSRSHATEAAPPASARSTSAPGRNEDAIRQAMMCLASSEKRLKKGEPRHTDEVLTLLRAAAAHLQQAAIEPKHSGGAE